MERNPEVVGDNAERKAHSDGRFLRPAHRRVHRSRAKRKLVRLLRRRNCRRASARRACYGDWRLHSTQMLGALGKALVIGRVERPDQRSPRSDDAPQRMRWPRLRPQDQHRFEKRCVFRGATCARCSQNGAPPPRCGTR